jgi:hypothetical protein
MALSGVEGFVNINGTPYNFGTWRLTIRAKLPDRSGFLSQGYQANVAGRKGGTIALSGPYDGGLPLAAGEEYEFHLGLAAGLFLVVNARVEEIVPSNDADDAPKIDVTAQTNGPFTAAVT